MLAQLEKIEKYVHRKNSYSCLWKTMSLKQKLGGGSNPKEKYESKWVHLPQFSGGGRIKNIFELKTTI